LYEFVKTLPGTLTQAAFAEQLEITVGGPLFPEHAFFTMGLLLSGMHVSGRSVVMKVLHAANATSDGKPLEAQAASCRCSRGMRRSTRTSWCAPPWCTWTFHQLMRAFLHGTGAVTPSSCSAT
jgi:hypothetical protein